MTWLPSRVHRGPPQKLPPLPLLVSLFNASDRFGAEVFVATDLPARVSQHGVVSVGETEQRIYALSAWRETPFFSDRERTALEWTEAVTLVATTHAPDDVYERVRRQFNETELVSLTFVIVAIHAWNRVSISFRAEAGTYRRLQSHGQPRGHSA